ncbi:acyl-CoA dehydrogenase [Kineosporia mesophila]|uniref:Acyl-CoA dehydrogenase n=1 Tax=Kineosporia mesophila TaxID=566012 RepID=A0ABP6ZDQ7_9ACTN|nr:acyl-CoA dehydrogenase family protein [Kineosporia mesophila]MCD5350112.1 hypothetical protein [Kineosporia mesophila]
MPIDDFNDLADLLHKAGKVAAEIFASAAETEKLGRPAPAAVAALQQSGLLALTAPRSSGGLEAGLGLQARVALELGKGCPSVGWVASLSNAAKAMVGPMLGPTAQVALFEDPQAIACASGVGTGKAVREDNGDLRISGRWRMASGCDVATWASLVVSVLDESGRPVEAGIVLTRVKDLEIDRSWRSAGLQGTGSYALVAEDILVHSAFSVVGPVGHQGPPPAVVSLGAIIAHLAPMVGAALGQVEAARNLFSGDRVPSRTTYARLVESPLARDYFARAERMVRAAERDTLAVADALDSLGPGQEPSAELRSTWRMDLVSAAGSCRSAMEYLLDLHGAAGFDPQEPLQRVWRDVAVGTRYVGLNPYIAAEDHARVLLNAGPAVSTL